MGPLGEKARSVGPAGSVHVMDVKPPGIMSGPFGRGWRRRWVGGGNVCPGCLLSIAGSTEGAPQALAGSGDIATVAKCWEPGLQRTHIKLVSHGVHRYKLGGQHET